VQPSEPFVSIEINPATAADREKLAHGVQALMADDPMLRRQADPQTGRTTIFGIGELQLEIAVERLKREFHVEATGGRPQVVYRETFTRQADGNGRYAAQRLGRGEYGHVRIHLSPGARGTGYVFANEVVDGSIPHAFIKPIEEGIAEALTRGVRSGYPVDDVRIEVYDGSYHDLDSSAAAFKRAGAMAFQDAAKKANAVLLEPVVRVEVIGPQDCIGGVADNLARRRGGRIQWQEDRAGAAAVTARVPFSEMLGYAADLRLQTQGRATYSIALEGFETVHGGAEDNEGERGAPVRMPRPPRPGRDDSAIALPEPADEVGETAG
jgi:elongation factor G